MLALHRGPISVHAWTGTTAFRATIVPTATTETATAMDASFAVVNKPFRTWLPISDIATTHKMTTEKITENRNEYKSKTMRGSILTVKYPGIRSRTTPGAFFQDANHVCTQDALPIGLFHLDRANAVEFEPLVEHWGHAGEEDPFGTEHFDALLQEILPIHSVRPYT
jgi:hypothetical protein